MSDCVARSAGLVAASYRAEHDRAVRADNPLTDHSAFRDQAVTKPGSHSRLFLNTTLPFGRSIRSRITRHATGSASGCAFKPGSSIRAAAWFGTAASSDRATAAGRSERCMSLVLLHWTCRSVRLLPAGGVDGHQYECELKLRHSKLRRAIMERRKRGG